MNKKIILEIKQGLPFYFVIISIPFLLFYWTLPFVSDFTIGNDYLKFSISHQMELFFSLKSGSVPLYAPGFSAGQSVSALTLGQFFHPLSVISSIMPGYWTGKAVEWNTLLKLLSLGITQLVLFLFLRKIRLSVLYSFLLSFITVYNLRLLDLFRHGAPLEGYTAFLILYAAIGWYCISPTKWAGPLAIICTTYLLVCSGHPEEMYYGMLGGGVFMLAAPFLLPQMLPGMQADFRSACRFWLKTGSFLLAGILLSAVYVLPFYFDFIAVNADRVTQTYAMANSNLDTFIGTLDNFFFPLRSQVNSAFGGSMLIIIPLALPVLSLFKIKIPRSVWFIWGFCFVVFLHMQGSRTPVHKLVWQYLPLASSIRDPGRISIMLPFFMMIISAWIIKAEPVAGGPKRFSLYCQPLTILGFTAALLLLAYYLLHVAGTFWGFPKSLTLFSTYFSENISTIPFFQVELAVFLLGTALLLLLAFYGKDGKAGRLIGFCLAAVILLQVGIVLRYRSINWIEKKFDSPTFQEMQEQKKDRLDYRYYPGFGLGSAVVKTQMERSFIEPFLGKIFTEVIPVKNQDEAYTRMEHARLPYQAFIEGFNPQEARIMTQGAREMHKGTVELVYSSFNKLQFRVYSEAPAIFGLSYPYSENWEAWLNGNKAVVYPLNGAALGIAINKGDNIIEFRYWSNAFFLGMVISCVTFALIGLFVCYRGLNGVKRTAGMILVCSIAAVVYALWYHSLYSGDNLETQYYWTYSSPAKTVNLAYGKRNWLGPSTLSSSRGERELDLYRSRFVDGDPRLASGFTTKLCDTPTWFLDLARRERIKKIVLYEPGENVKVDIGPLTVLERFGAYASLPQNDAYVNMRPVSIDLSDDGRMWITAASVMSPLQKNTPVSVIFDKARSARYLRIRASGMSRLAFDEVEVYGPDSNDLM